jgi:hypothetical protein
LNAWPSEELPAASARGATAAQSEIASIAQINVRAARFCQRVAPTKDTSRAYLLGFGARRRRPARHIASVGQRKP